MFLDLEEGKERLVKELIADETNLTNHEAAFEEDTISQASESDSDPGEDTLAPNELTKILPDRMIQALK